MIEEITIPVPAEFGQCNFSGCILMAQCVIIPNMVPIYFRAVTGDENGERELRLGWPTWDEAGKDREMSVKFIYQRKDGRPSRGSPEVPVNIAVEMVDLAAEHNQLTSGQVKKLLKRLKALKGSSG